MLRRFLARVVSSSLIACLGADARPEVNEAQSPVPALARVLAVQVSQDKPSQEKEDKYEFFSGTIVAVQKEKVSVLRAIPGKPGETKSFSIKETTIVEGKLEVEARVTVGYVTEDAGDVAIRIIVREGR